MARSQIQMPMESGQDTQVQEMGGDKKCHKVLSAHLSLSPY